MSPKPKSVSPAKATEKTFRGLRTFNLVMGFLHLFQGVLMLVITFSLNKTYPIFTNYLKFDVASLALVPGKGGVFEVTVDDRSVWSKQATGQFPDPDALVAEVKKLRRRA